MVLNAASSSMSLALKRSRYASRITSAAATKTPPIPRPTSVISDVTPAEALEADPAELDMIAVSPILV